MKLPEIHTGKHPRGIVEESKLLIKGIRDGLLITVHEKRWKDAQELVFNTIAEREAFFKGAKVALDVGETVIKAAEMGKFRNNLADKGLSLWAVLSTADTTINTAQVLGLATTLGIRTAAAKEQKDANVFEGDQAVWVERTLRAGFRVETKCHVVVMGDVNPGAEIISGGNILVWGRLNGSVHAGADGNQNARIMAMELKPTQMKINGVVSALILKKSKNQPEMAFLKENEIIIEPWNSKK